MQKVEKLKELAFQHIRTEIEEAILKMMTLGETQMKLKGNVPDSIVSELIEAGYNVRQSRYGKNTETTVEWS